jgi:hypothetical protein
MKPENIGSRCLLTAEQTCKKQEISSLSHSAQYRLDAASSWGVLADVCTDDGRATARC